MVKALTEAAESLLCFSRRLKTETEAQANHSTSTSPGRSHSPQTLPQALARPPMISPSNLDRKTSLGKRKAGANKENEATNPNVRNAFSPRQLQPAAKRHRPTPAFVNNVSHILCL